MMLSRLVLNPHSRDVQRALGDSHAMHVRVMAMFPEAAGTSPRAAHGILHRLDRVEGRDTLILLVQSREPPDCARLPQGFLDPALGPDAFATRALAPVLAAIEAGTHFRFRLRANTTRRIDTKSGPDGTRRQGRRVPVRGDDGRQSWLESRLGAHGFRLVGPSEQRAEGKTTGRGGGTTRTHEGCLFDGIIEVVDAELARRAVTDGIGPAKAYGFGLLSLARP
jgi:CRISPR system Cascade subunit CasE